MFYEEDLEGINKIFESFLDRSQSKCVLLIDKEGHLVCKKGFTKSFNTDTIAALVAGSFAATREVAKQTGRNRILGCSSIKARTKTSTLGWWPSVHLWW